VSFGTGKWHNPEKIDLSGKAREPDQWQPDWMVKKVFLN
jgi:hypothetical protein